MTEAPIWRTPPYEVVDENFQYGTFAASWGVPAGVFDQIWNGSEARTGVTGKGVIIANLDSGVYSKHRLLQQPDKIIAKRNFVGGDIEDDNGHGSATATNSAAIRDDGDYIGVAPDAQLIVGKVFTSRGSGPALYEEIKWAADEGAHIINYSGGGSSPWDKTEEAIAYANEKGCIVCVSSGNAGPNTRNWPAYFDNCLSIGATQENGTLAPFSTTNQRVDVAAPGMRVAVGNRQGGISLMNGTSFSCPWFSGMLALVLEDHWKNGKPGVGNIEAVRALIDENSGPDIDPHKDYNYGIPNALSMATSIARKLYEKS